MNDHESVQATGPSQTQPRTRTRARAKITVGSSDAKPYDQTVRPALVEVRLGETMARSDCGEVVSAGVGFLVINDEGRVVCDCLFAEV